MNRELSGECEVSDFLPADQGATRALILAGLVEHWGRLDESLNADLDDIVASYGHGRTVVVRDRGSIVATGTVVPRDDSTVEILRMSVDTEHRRSGLGRLVVDELVTTARRWGASAVVLETSSDWHEVVEFYRSCGFEITHHDDGPFGRDTWFRLEL